MEVEKQRTEANQYPVPFTSLRTLDAEDKRDRRVVVGQLVTINDDVLQVDV